MNQFKLALLFICLSFAGISQNAGEYMDYFSTDYQQIQTDMWDYTRTVSHGKSARKVDKRRMELIQTSTNALNRAKKAKAFNGSTRYRDSVVRYFEIINLVLKEDYAKLVDMEEVAEQSYDLMEAYMMAKDLASEKQSEAAKMVSREQKIFAEANNINLIESTSELDEKMSIASDVYSTYNEIYLIFFKSFKQEVYLVDAISRQDVNAIEQNREGLKATVQEGYEKLDAVELYKGDKTMIQASKELFKFYEEEATEGMDKAQEYFAKIEQFNQVKKAFDEIKEKNRTQEDVDKYNNAVNEMNAAIEAYNEFNEYANKKRAELIDNWNKVAEKFTHTYVPKGK